MTIICVLFGVIHKTLPSHLQNTASSVGCREAVNLDTCFVSLHAKSIPPQRQHFRLNTIDDYGIHC